MDIAYQVEIALRDAGYATWRARQGSNSVVCFENPVLIGFVYVFDSTTALLNQWESAQETVLKQYNGALRGAREKAWNVYSIFLTGEKDPSRQRAIERLEENFALTRKIACGSIRTAKDVQHVLLPITSVQAQPSLGATDFKDRLKNRLKEVPSAAVRAFLANTDVSEVAHILEESP